MKKKIKRILFFSLFTSAMTMFATACTDNEKTNSSQTNNKSVSGTKSEATSNNNATNDSKDTPNTETNPMGQSGAHSSVSNSEKESEHKSPPTTMMENSPKSKVMSTNEGPNSHHSGMATDSSNMRHTDKSSMKETEKKVEGTQDHSEASNAEDVKSGKKAEESTEQSQPIAMPDSNPQATPHPSAPTASPAPTSAIPPAAK